MLLLFQSAVIVENPAMLGETGVGAFPGVAVLGGPVFDIDRRGDVIEELLVTLRPRMTISSLCTRYKNLYLFMSNKFFDG